jgi:hypothetical protein
MPDTDTRTAPFTEAETVHGGCHCGAVRFEAVTALDSLGDCNCSRCARLGWVMQSVPDRDFTLLSGTETLTPYRFNTERIEHLFCPVCGIESFARGTDAEGHALYMVNVNCLEGVEIDRDKVHHWDGRSF